MNLLLVVTLLVTSMAILQATYGPQPQTYLVYFKRKK